MERDARELCSVELSSFLRGWGGWLKISGAGSLQYSVQGGKGFVTETCRVHKFVSVVFSVLGSVGMSCNCLSFSKNECLSESRRSSYCTQRQVFTWALLRRRAATDRLQGSLTLLV